MDTQVEARFFQCPVDAGLALMAGKWKPRLLWKLYRYQTMRFSQFKRMLPDITDKMLTQQLRELEADGLIIRKVYPVVPPKVEYTFSTFGKLLDRHRPIRMVHSHQCPRLLLARPGATQSTASRLQSPPAGGLDRGCEQARGCLCREDCRNPDQYRECSPSSGQAGSGNLRSLRGMGHLRLGQ